MNLSPRKILSWLRGGYPHGVPREDYIALLGVLQRHLTEEEIVWVAEQVRKDHGDEPIPVDAIRDRIRHVLQGNPSVEDVRRVHGHLAAGGWPLAGDVDDSESDPEH